VGLGQEWHWRHRETVTPLHYRSADTGIIIAKTLKHHGFGVFALYGEASLQLM
jgi:hypothetical protein